MILDNGQEALDPQAARGHIRLIGMFLIPAAIALTTTIMQCAMTPGFAQHGHAVKQFASRGALVGYTGTLAASSEVISRVVEYTIPATGLSYVFVVEGTPALTTAGAVAPTDAAVEAALPTDAEWQEVGRVKFKRDSGTVVTLDNIDHTHRIFDAIEDQKAVTGDEDFDAAAAGYVPYGTIRFTVDAANIADGDLLTDRPLPLIYGRIKSWRAIVEKAISTGAKTTLPHLEIGATAITGTDGTAFAGVKALGVVTTLGAPTALNTFKPGDVLSIVAATTTTFIEGRVAFEIDVEQLLA